MTNAYFTREHNSICEKTKCQILVQTDRVWLFHYFYPGFIGL